MPAMAPAEIEGCGCWFISSADLKGANCSSDEVVEARELGDCEVAAPAMLESVRVLCMDKEASCGILSPGSRTYFAF